jgi:muramoyltetrapeptide carboxypeptidase LdcA involved in peptidoglycan recycling
VLREGDITAPLVAFNLSTLVASAGTPEWPDLVGRILLIEEMACPISRFERSLRQLERIGVFDQIEALLVGKPEDPNAEGAPFDRDELLKEILGDRLSKLPVMTEVDCGHTVPMITLPQEVRVRAHWYQIPPCSSSSRRGWKQAGIPRANCIPAHFESEFQP